MVCSLVTPHQATHTHSQSPSVCPCVRIELDNWLLTCIALLLQIHSGYAQPMQPLSIKLISRCQQTLTLDSDEGKRVQNQKRGCLYAPTPQLCVAHGNPARAGQRLTQCCSLHTH
jgi:hypothetical protein